MIHSSVTNALREHIFLLLSILKEKGSSELSVLGAGLALLVDVPRDTNITGTFFTPR
jgi:hypothetical protein